MYIGPIYITYLIVVVLLVIAAPPIFLGEIAPFVVLARGIFLGVFRVGKAENEVKIL